MTGRRPLRPVSVSVSVSRRRGAILPLALLSLLLLSAAVFYIFNVGTHLQRRTETQNAADAAAGAGAGWVARSMNLVAMNNVEITKLLAQVQILDSMPSAVSNSLEDHNAALTGIEAQMRRRVQTTGDPWLQTGLTAVQTDLLGHVVMLEALNTQLNESGYDIAELTHYDLGGGQRGALWDAMLALDAMSLTAMEELGPLAQRMAVLAAQQNQRDEEAQGFLVPFVPELPWERGTIDDFETPFLEGRLPDDIDDEEFARGPYDAVFGWRVPELRVRVEAIDYPQQLDTDYDVPGFNRRSEQAVSGEVIGYDTYGPRQFFFGQLDAAEEDAFGVSETGGAGRSWFAERARRHAQEKANQLWGRDLASPLYPDASWQHDYGEYESRLQSGGRPAALFIFLEFSPVQVSATGRPLDTPTLVDWGFAPDAPVPGGDLTRDYGDEIGDHVWRSTRRLSDSDPTSGRRREYVQYLYFVWCASSDQDAIATYRNPNNFPADIEPADLPAPIRLKADALNYDDPAARERYLRFFAAADQPARAGLWGQLFDGEGDAQRPRQRVTATASASVFNTHSWDLWTQMWHAQLAPVDDLGGWVTVMRETGVATEDIPDLDPDEVGETYNYLRTVAPLMEIVGEVRGPRE